MFIDYLQSDPRHFFAVVFTVVISITVHELAHGVTAVRLGDDTPIETGHMTFNPLVHMGLFSIACLLVAGIAWGAMPINPDRLRRRWHESLVALAGPVSNVLMALLALTVLGLWIRFDPVVTGRSNASDNLHYLLQIFGLTNIALALFNLLPVPPLDGSKIVGGLSASFDHAMRVLTASPVTFIVIIATFSRASEYIFAAATKVAMWYIGLLLGG